MTQRCTSAGATFCPETPEAQIPPMVAEQRLPFVSAMPNLAQPILIEQLFPIHFQGSKLAADFLQAHTGLGRRPTDLSPRFWRRALAVQMTIDDNYPMHRGPGQE